MPFQLPLNHKFGCLCLVYAGVDRALRDPINLRGDIWAIPGPPFDLEEHWQNWLGSIKSEALSHTSLTVLAHARSDRPGILDDENKRLADTAVTVFYGLLMREVFHHDLAVNLSGANDNGRVGLRSVSELAQHIRPNGVRLARIDHIALEQAARIGIGLRTIHNVPEYERLRRGFHAWTRGVQEYYGGDRLHQFVRAVDAVVKSEVGRSEALFVHRCQIFAGTTEAERDVFRELYQLRSQTEHMNPLGSVLEKYPEGQRETIALRRAYQAQLLANDVYTRILTKPALLTIFDSDPHTEDFWRLRMDEQQAVWGEPINLESLASARFTL